MRAPATVRLLFIAFGVGIAAAPGSRTEFYLPEIDRLVVAIRASGKGPASVWVLGLAAHGP
jgi:hypothetical protein